MNVATTTTVVLALATVVIKATGPVLVGGHEFPPLANRVIALLAPALLAALIVTQTFATRDQTLTIDARAAGLAAAAAILAWRDSLIGAVVGAAVVTALVRLVV
jgi:branched-subunit amino acid transport protein